MKITFDRYLKQRGFNYGENDVIELYGMDILHEMRDEYNEKYDITPKIIKNN